MIDARDIAEALDRQLVARSPKIRGSGATSGWPAGTPEYTL